MEDSIKTISDHLSEIRWSNLKTENNKLSIDRPDGFVIAEVMRAKITIQLGYYNRNDDTYNLQSGLNKIVFDKDIELNKVIYLSVRRAYGLNRESLVKDILQIRSGGKYSDAETIDISRNHRRMSFSSRTKVLKMPLVKFEEVVSDADKIDQISRSYFNSIKRHLTNRAVANHLGIQTRNVTNITKGEFAFLTHRFNLETKESTSDYKRFLNKDDIEALQRLSLALIENEVFDLEYLRKLDAYFLKEKLEQIIELGNEILDLGVPNLDTDKAKVVIDKLTKDDDDSEIAQLETVWQRYFERYLLYLIFTYREIYPKIELNLEGDEKRPDFIGINHYYGVDSIEIKTHLKPVLTRDSSHDNFAFSAELSKAIIQTTNYIDAIKQRSFTKDSDFEKITETTDQENLHRPRGIIVISSSDRLIKNQGRYDAEKIQRDFTKLRNSLDSIEILTFDEVINIADNYSKKIAGKIESIEQE